MMRIYALCDPDTSEIRYVGKTKQSLTRRLKGHMSAVRGGSTSHVANWIRTLGALPHIEPIDEYETECELNAAERYWIWWYRHVLGARLTNLTEGGDGGDTSGAFTEEGLRRMRAASERRWMQEDARRKQADVARQTHVGRKRSDETRRRMSEAAQRVAADPEVRQRRSEAAQKRWYGCDVIS